VEGYKVGKEVEIMLGSFVGLLVRVMDGFAEGLRIGNCVGI